MRIGRYGLHCIWLHGLLLNRPFGPSVGEAEEDEPWDKAWCFYFWFFVVEWVRYKK